MIVTSYYGSVMNLSEKKLIDLLEGGASDRILTPSELAHLYVHSALLVAVMVFIKEQIWLKKKDEKVSGEVTTYEDLITPFFKNELLSVNFLKEFLIKSGPLHIKKITHDSQAIEKEVIETIKTLSSNDKKLCATLSLCKMTELFLHEEKLQKGKAEYDGHQGMRLYRTFDNFDTILQLNYQLDKDMVVDFKTKERLYQKAGAGVQSGYSTILLALHTLKLAKDSKVIDLGSGYGRVGLVCALLRPDVHFIGYEFVSHRVKNAKESCHALGLEKSLSFVTQDLSLKEFKIPDADVYYLYDPFTKETYDYILQQIVDLSKRAVVTTVTKGNARGWLLDISEDNSWPVPLCIDDNNLCIFKSV